MRGEEAAQQLGAQRRQQLGGDRLYGLEFSAVGAGLWRRVRLDIGPEERPVLRGEKFGSLGGDWRGWPAGCQRNVDVLCGVGAEAR